jgi:uncharacterized protein (TIGR03663 family)
VPSVILRLLRWVPLALVVLGAFWLRTRELERRPMHADEANQAVKLGELLDAGSYAFDPRDHHGPTLYYAAVPVAWFRGERSLATLTETTVRFVPAIFGTVNVLLVFALAGAALRRDLSVSTGGGRHSPRGEGTPPTSWLALAAALFVALSPPSVYYSRYFIQETLLVTFTLATFAAGVRWWRTGLTRWAVIAGGGIGLMQATKASAPLFLVLATFAWLLSRGGARPQTRRPRRDLVFALAAALVSAALLYSSFGTNPAGVRDALGAYAHAATRFGAEAAPTGHEKPWWYYLNLFGWYRQGGLVWHQVAFSALAAVGFLVAWARREAFLRGVALYTAGVIAVFSFFAYKTPWHVVHFVPGLAVLAAATLAAIARLRTGRPVAVAFALITAMTLYQQTGRVAFLRPADQRNPYAYVHSSADVLKFRAVADAAVFTRPDQPLLVISEEYWPLPWYLRGLKRVGYYQTPPDDCDGALVIASATQADAVRARLKGTYRETFLGLRPGFVCILFVADP